MNWQLKEQECVTLSSTKSEYVALSHSTQDVMYKIGSPKFKIPFLLRYVKYLVLILLVVVIPYIVGQPWFCRICPAGTLTAGIPWALWNPVNPTTGAPVLPNGPGIMFYLALMVLAGFLIWFVVCKKVFC